MIKLEIDGKIRTVRDQGHRWGINWTIIGVLDKGRVVSEHTIPSDWFTNRPHTICVTGGHRYRHVSQD